jgi:hypothetical protein
LQIESKFLGFFRTSKRDGYNTNYSVNFGDNYHTIQLFIMESKGRVPTEKERIIQFEDGDRKITYIND